MKYGMRERISGIVIIVALAIMVLPMLFDAPDEVERPEGPVMSIDRPVSVSRQAVDEPRSPLDDQSERPQQSAPRSEPLLPDASDETRSRPEPELAQQAASPAGSASVAPADERETSASSDSGAAASGDAAAERDSAAEDPIMAAASGSAGRSGGDWAVQAGSFGQPENADRLIGQLREQGFDAYQRPRGNLHTVYVGPFDSTEASEQARTRLQSRANIKGLIVRREGGQ